MIFKPHALSIFERYAPVYDPVTLTVASLAATAAGAGVSAMGTIAGGDAAAAAGRSQQQAYDFKAKQEDMAGQEARASAQRQALEERRKGTLLQSTLQARSAAGGGAADDPTVVDLGGDLAQRSEYSALTDMYRGENRARGYEDSAAGARYSGLASVAEGEARQRASRLSAAGTIIGAVGSMARMGLGGGGGAGGVSDRFGFAGPEQRF